MTLKITHKQMIALYILIALFIGLLSFMLGPGGSIYVTLGLIIIFIIYKVHQYTKEEDQE
ncbi:MAG: hypothetical protein ACOC89_03285 [Candidatus Saliniplasma sp.]